MTDNNFGRRMQANDDVVAPVPKKQFFRFRQNNSGGLFDFDPDRGIGVNVWIEADDKEHAIYRAGRIGIYFDGIDIGRDCPCCGDRWYRPYDFEARDVPYMDRVYDTYVHYIDGRIERIEKNVANKGVQEGG